MVSEEIQKGVHWADLDLDMQETLVSNIRTGLDQLRRALRKEVRRIYRESTDEVKRQIFDLENDEEPPEILTDREEEDSLPVKPSAPPKPAKLPKLVLAPSSVSAGQPTASPFTKRELELLLTLHGQDKEEGIGEVEEESGVEDEEKRGDEEDEENEENEENEDEDGGDGGGDGGEEGKEEATWFEEVDDEEGLEEEFDEHGEVYEEEVEGGGGKEYEAEKREGVEEVQEDKKDEKAPKSARLTGKKRGRCTI